MAANIVALGALAQLTGAVSLESLTAAVLARVPKGTEDLNRRALAAGVAAAQAMGEGSNVRNPSKDSMMVKFRLTRLPYQGG